MNTIALMPVAITVITLIRALTHQYLMLNALHCIVRLSVDDLLFAQIGHILRLSLLQLLVEWLWTAQAHRWQAPVKVTANLPPLLLPVQVCVLMPRSCLISCVADTSMHLLLHVVGSRGGSTAIRHRRLHFTSCGASAAPVLLSLNNYIVQGLLTAPGKSH